MSDLTYRRVVTGIDKGGKSGILFDDELHRDMGSATCIWRSALPADNLGHDDAAKSFSTEMVHEAGSNFLLIAFAPGTTPYLHTTDTLDYFVMLAGKVTLELETGEVEIAPGDFIINRGVMHGWRNDGTETAMLAAFTVPSNPVGRGRTI